MFHVDQRSSKEARFCSVNYRYGEKRAATSVEVTEIAKG